MTHSPQLPPLQAQGPRPVIILPTPAAYRQTVPAFHVDDQFVATQAVDRKRRLLWFGVAVGLHGMLILGWWLSPPLRLKWGPSADAWVQVVSVPKPGPEALPLPYAQPDAGSEAALGIAKQKPPKHSAAVELLAPSK